jgi:hypothetical protein
MAGGFLMARDQLVMMKELVMPGALVHADGLADVRDRRRITRRADRHQGVVGDPALPDPLVTIRRPIPQWLVRGPVDARVGDLGAPALEPGVELLP